MLCKATRGFWSTLLTGFSKPYLGTSWKHLLGIVWNVKILTEKSCLPPPSNGSGVVSGLSIYEKSLLEKEWGWFWISQNFFPANCTKYPDLCRNVMFPLPHRDGVGDQITKKCYQELHDMSRNAQRTHMFANSIPHRGGVILQNVFLGIEWNVKICREKSCLLATHLSCGWGLVNSQIISPENLLECPDLHSKSNLKTPPLMGWG